MQYNFHGYLLVSDVDGTMITKDFQIPRRNIQAIERFVDAGGLFTLATGRSAFSAKPYYEKVKTTCPAIVYNGAGLYDYDKDAFIWQKVLSDSVKSLCKKVFEVCPTVGVEIYSEKDLFVIRPHRRVKEHIGREAIEHTLADLDAVMDKPWNKILFAAETEELEALEAFYNKQPHEDCYAIWSSFVYYEVVPAGADKGGALKELARIQGIPIEKTFAIGDFYNDVEMLKTAGIGAAPENMPEEVLSQADYITTKCENGAVADFIGYLEKRFQKRDSD